MPSKRAPFQPGHAVEYAVEVTSRDSKGSATACCLFCMHEGRDDVAVGRNGRKRQRTGKIKFFTEPFFLHKYRSHHESQHSESWVSYQQLARADKEQYFAGLKCIVRATKCDVLAVCSSTLLLCLFSGKVKAGNTLHRHMSAQGDKITYL